MTDETIVLPTMTIEEAIKKLEKGANVFAEDYFHRWPDHERALRLGVEALKRLQAMKAQYGDFFDWAPLPGETLEET